MHSSRNIRVASRASPLARSQVEEVLLCLQKKGIKVEFIPTFLKTVGDIDLKTPLRNVTSSDFFTREVDAKVLEGACDIAIHSAKDLPDPIPEGLEVVAITEGVDSSDSLVFRENESLDSLKKGAKIGISCERREKAVLALRSDFLCVDIRGTIEERLKKLTLQHIDGVVVAEAALIRLKLAHLNRMKLPSEVAPLQGKLAVVSRKDHREMKALFSLLDTRSPV